MAMTGNPLSRIRVSGVFVAGLALLLALGDARAHPHAWMDIETTLRFDDSGHVTAMAQRWTFDPIYSAILMEEMRGMTPGGTDEDRLQALADQMMSNIRNFSYLTHFEQGDEAFSGSSVEDVTLTIGERERLRLSFDLLLEAPRAVDRQPLRYRIYDPVYYIDMSHGSADAVDVGDAARPCRVGVEAPEPDAAQIARASAVDIGSAQAQGLGRHFAERVSVFCPPAGG